MISGTCISFCKGDISLIDNYYIAINDDTQVYDCHHKLEIQEDKILTRDDLKSLDLYYRRPPEELIFLTHSEHTKLHSNHRKDEYYKKLSEKTKGKNKGKTPWCKGKHLSDETKEKISAANTGKHHSEETKRKWSEQRKGENNGMYGKGYLLKGDKNGMYGKQHTEETRRKLREAAKKRDHTKLHWYNNGVICKFCETCPEGFMPGRLKKK